MQTITEEQFFERFMKICQKLTYAEVRMLYLLITEPYIIELPQQKFAKRIHVHRRTINIGIKKLRMLKYINDSVPIGDIDVGRNKEKNDSIIISEHAEATARKVIINLFLSYYTIKKKSFIIYEDFYSFILGDISLPLKYRNDKNYIKETIKGTYPQITFYSDMKKSDYKDENLYYLIRLVNSEIIRARNDRHYGIKTQNLLQKIEENFSITEEQALNILKSEFPKIRITEKKIFLRKPYKGKARY